MVTLLHALQAIEDRAALVRAIDGTDGWVTPTAEAARRHMRGEE